ncbi:hypothetical protein AB0C76_00535 [Kitasatospora sp. NPDC048722]|uniref:hypothetical protein n=1 Tax=Kitasatospora sp. NPDC048722 TaxID=3155639 RepID=UPI0033DDFFA8
MTRAFTPGGYGTSARTSSPGAVPARATGAPPGAQKPEPPEVAGHSPLAPALVERTPQTP